MRKFHGTLRKFGAICLAAALLFSAIGTLNFATYAASWSTPDEMTQTNKLITVKYSGGVKTDDEGFVWENGDIAICTPRKRIPPVISAWPRFRCGKTSSRTIRAASRSIRRMPMAKP